MPRAEGRRRPMGGEETARALAAVGRELAASGDLARTARGIVASVLDLFRARRASLLRLDPAREALVCVATAGEGDSGRWLRQTFRVGEGVVGLAVAQRRPVWSPDARNDPGVGMPPFSAAWSRQEGWGAAAGVPLIAGGEVMGALAVGDVVGRAFTAQDLRLLAAFGDLAAVALHNARLLHAEQERRRQLEALAAVGQALSASLNIDDVLGILVERAATATGADAAGILMPDPETDLLRFRRAHGFSRLHVERVALPRGVSVAGVALATGRPQWTPDIRADQRFPLPDPMRAHAEAEGIRAILAVPVPGQDQPMGALGLLWREPRAFQEEEIGFAARIAELASVAIRNAVLHEAERARRLQVEAVRDLGHEIARQIDLRSLLDLMARRVVDLMGADSAVVWLWDEAHEILVPRAWSGFGEWLAEVRLRPGEGVAGVVAQERTGRIVNDYPSFAGAHPVFRHRAPTRALIAEPLLYGGRLLGVISVGHLQAGRAFCARDSETLTLFATQAAIAIRKARLYQEAQRRAVEAEALGEVGRALSASLRLEEVLARLAERAGAATGADAVGVLRPDPATGELRYRGAFGFSQRVLDVLALPPGCGVSGAAMATGTPQWSPDVQADPRFPLSDAVRAVNEAEGLRALLSVPIPGPAGPLGTLVLAWRSSRRLEEEQIAFASRIAEQAAIAVENARLFEESQQRAREAAALADVARRLSASLELDEVLQVIVDAVQEISGVPFVGVMILDAARGELTYAKGVGLSAERLARVRLRVGEGIAGQAVERGQPVVCADIRSDPSYVLPGPADEEQFRSLVCVPVAAAGRPLGVLAAFREEVGGFSAAEVDLLARFADQAALALENARLYGEAQREVAERKGAEQLLAEEKRILEMVAAGAPLPRVLEALCRAVERLARGVRCSVLLLDRDGVHLRAGAAPSLPAEYVRGVDGMPIGPSAGSCGTAAWRKAPVVVPDIATDPLWEDGRHLALAHGLRACWSTPVLGADGSLLATLAMYYGEPRQPTEEELRLIERATHLAGIALERHRAEEALRQSEGRQALIFRAVPLAVYTARPEAPFATTWISENVKALSGMERDQMLSDPASWESRIHPEDRDRVLEALGAAVAGGEPASLEYRWRHADGTWRWYLDRAVVRRGPDGAPLELVGVWMDITERKLADRALRASEERFRSLSASSPVGVLLIDAEGRCTYANPRSQAICGFTLEESLDLGWTRFVHPEDRPALLRDWVGSAREARERAGEFRFAPPGADVRWVHLRSAPMLSHGTYLAGHVCTLEDITERKRMEELLHTLYRGVEAQRDRLRALSLGILRAREEEATRIAHALHDEAGQLLVGVYIALDEALRHVPAEVRARFDDVRKLLREIEEQLRCLSHELRPTMLDDLGLRRALEFLAQGVSARLNIPVVVTGDAAGPLPWPVKTGVYRIVQEALNNAGRHAGAHRLSVCLEGDGRGVRCTVRDDGVGFDVDVVLARRGEKGLGLIGIRERVEALGGTLHIESAPGQGTALHVSIPLGR